MMIRMVSILKVAALGWAIAFLFLVDDSRRRFCCFDRGGGLNQYPAWCKLNAFFLEHALDTGKTLHGESGIAVRAPR